MSLKSDIEAHERFARKSDGALQVHLYGEEHVRATMAPEKAERAVADWLEVYRGREPMPSDPSAREHMGDRDWMEERGD